VREFKGIYGLNSVLRAIGLNKRTWYYSRQRQRYEEKYAYLRKPLFAIARAHPEYGIQRTTAELKDRGIRINHKVIEKLHQGWNLSVLRSIRKPKPSPIRTIISEAGPYTNLVATLDAIDIFEVLYTDFTEIVYRRGKAKAELMPIIDHCSKLAVGHALGDSADTEMALKAWRKAASTLQRYGRKTKGIIIHHDQDSVYISHRWLYEIAIKCNARVSYSENGAKENVHMESFNGRFKSENRLLFWEQDDFESLEKVVNDKIRYYNRIRRHSSLGNKSPMKYLKEKGKISR
jgi:putative transposase